MGKMESRWYLFSGQTLENTKISDRVHALHITQSGWDGITKHLDRKKLMQEAADKEAAIKKYLDDGSKNMTKGWENSLENVRRRKEEERLRLIEEKKEERQQKFLKLREEQEEIRTKYMDKVKKQIFMTTGHARDLTSALVTSEVLYEREKQQEFTNKLKKHDKEDDKYYLECQEKKAEKETKEDEEKKKKNLEKEKKYEKELKKMIEERALEEKTLREERVKKEATDNREAVKEMEKIEQMLIEDKLKKKRELFEEKRKFLKQQKELELQKIKEDKELDEVIEIYRDTKHKIDCMKKLRERELRDAVLKRREKIASMVMAEQMDRSEAEERSIKKAMAERDAAELEKIKARLDKDEKNKQERLQNRREVLAREEERKKKEEEIKKWELLNRYKTDESMNKYEEGKKKELWQQILKYRKMLCDQMEDNKMEQLREKEIDEAFAKTQLGEEDAKFFEYADEVLQLAKKKGRTTYPIERVITKYVKEMNIQSDTYGKQNDPCKPKLSTALKKVIKKSPKSKPCRCYCPKK